jgi:hypothetical protein
MSWALWPDEEKEVRVTGTVMTIGNGEEALEVIFALREVGILFIPFSAFFYLSVYSNMLKPSSCQTSHIQKASLSPALKSWGLHPATTSKHTKFSSSSSHYTHNSASSVSKQSNSKRNSKENPTRKSKSLSTSVTDNVGLGLGVGGGDSRFETLVRNLKKAHEEAVKDSSSAAAVVLAPGSSTSSKNQTPADPPLPSTNSTIATTMTRYARSSDFPLSNSQIWCGPPRQKVGRPPKNKDKDKGKDRDKSRGLFTREPLVRGRLGSTSTSSTSGNANVNGPATNTTTTDEQTQATLLALLAALSSDGGVGQGTAPNNANGVLLNTLGAIDSGSGSGSRSGEGEGNVALVKALKELLAAATACETPPPSSHTTNTSTINPALITHVRSRSDSNSGMSVAERAGEGGGDDEEIIVLDKENVNPGAFRRKGGKGDFNTNSGSKGSGTGEREREKERVGLGERSNSVAAGGRKRTLSDFMEEKEAGRERDKVIDGKKRTTTTTSSMMTIQHTRSDMDYPFGTPRVFSNSVLTANLAFRPHTSPPRPTFGSGYDHPFQRALSFGSTASTSAANSPDSLPVFNAPPSDALNSNPNPPKKYVVPAWARTNTTTQPRLSEEVLAQRAAAAAEAEAEAEKERKKRKGRGGRRKSENGKDKEDEKSAGEGGTKNKQQRPQLGTTSNILSLPVCASSDVTVVSPSSPLQASSPASTSDSSATPIPFSSQDSTITTCPKTPPPRHRRRHTFTPLSKNAIMASGGGGSALFTPTPRKLSGLFDSPLFSPSASVARMKGKAKISPIRAVTSGKGWNVDDMSEDEDEEERLARELDGALEELDAPSSSLPIASSDFDTKPPATSSSSGGHLSAAEEQDGEDETMRYWSTGLPPSSPPPPTSPMLQSQTDDDDMDDISNAMSDSDGLTFEHDALDQEQEQDQFLSGISSDYMNSDIPFSDDLAICFDDFNQLFSDPMTGTINTNEDTSLLPLPSSDPVVQNGIADFDFTQFWESVKPLVDQSMVASSDGLASDGIQADSDTSARGEIDHVKLADEVHALFSGCLM